MTPAASDPFAVAPAEERRSAWTRLWSALRRPWNLALIALLLALFAAGGYVGGRRLIFDQHRQAAQAALDDQDCDAAQPHLDACFRLRPGSAEAHFVAARGLRRAGFYDEAADHLRECQRLDGQTPQTVLEWSMLGAARGDLPANEPFLNERLDAGVPETGLILEALAQGNIHVYQLARASYYLDLLLKREPDNALGLLWQGWLYEATGRPDEALANYRRAVSLRPRQPAVRLRLAQLALHRGELDEAEEHLEELRARGYHRSEVLLALARCRVQRGDPASASTLLDTLLAESPDDGEALVERGKIALGEDAAQAEALLQRAVAVMPQSRQALNFLQQALAQQGKTHEAGACAERLKRVEADLKQLEALYKKMRQAPNDAGPRCEAGLLCLRNGQDAEALRWLTGALQMDPQNAPAHRALAEYYERAGDAALAAQHRQAAAAGPR